MFAKPITKESVRDTLFNFFTNKMENGESEIERVRCYEDVYCTSDNGIVIDCEDDKQIRLIIQVD